MKAEVSDRSCYYYGVAGGQLVAFFAAFASFMTEMLGSYSRPMFMAACNSILLGIVYLPYNCSKKGFQLSAEWWKYAGVALIDIGANYFSLLALKFTSITSWSLVQPFSFVAVVPLSLWLLHAKYNWRHLMSGIVAIGGLVILLLSDLEGGKSSEQHSAHMVLLGDIFAILGAILYGSNSALVEAILKGKAPQCEVLGMLGSFGCVYGFSIAFLLGEISVDMFPKSTVPIYTAASVLSNFGAYSLGMFVLKHAGAAVFEISFLATNLWSIFWKLTVMHSFHTQLIGFIVSFAMIVSGVTCFTLSGDPNNPSELKYTALETELPNQKTIEV